jgi:hypothetical protein
VHGTDVDDAAGLLGVAQPPDKGLREEEGTAQIHGHHLVVVGFGGIPESGLLFHAGVVDQDVGGAEARPGFLDKRVVCVEAGDIGLHDLGLASGGFDGLYRLLGAVRLAHVVDDDFGAFDRETFGDSLPDAGTGTGDDGNFPLQSLHLFLSPAHAVRVPMIGCGERQSTVTAVAPEGSGP